MTNAKREKPDEARPQATGVPSFETRTERQFSGDRVALTAIVAAVFGWSILMFRRSADIYLRCGTGMDTAVFDQAAWLIAHGYAAFVTVRGMPLLADHFSAIMYPVALLVRNWQDARGLFAVQAFFVGLGAVPVYLLARNEGLSTRISTACAVTYLCYPAVTANATEGFYPDCFLVPSIIAALLGFRLRSMRIFVGFAIVSMLCRESTGLVYIAFAASQWKGEDKRLARCSLISGACGLIVALSCMRIWNGGHPSGYIVMFREYGETPMAIAGYFILHPLMIILKLVSTDMVTCYSYLILPTLGIALCTPRILVSCLPLIVLNALSSRQIIHLQVGHHSAAISGVVFVSFVCGLASLNRRWPKFWCRATPALVFAAIAAGLSLFPAILDPHTSAPVVSYATAFDVHRMVAAIPPGAAVSADKGAVGLLTHRRRIYIFPNPIYAVQYGPSKHAQMEIESGPYARAINTNYSHLSAPDMVDYFLLLPVTTQVGSAQRADYMAVLASNEYGVVEATPAAVLLKRGADHALGLRLLAKAVRYTSRCDGNEAKICAQWLSGQWIGM